MPKKKEPLVKAWSASRLNAYRQCPLKFKLSNIDKIKEPQSKAMARGNIIHQFCEDHINGDYTIGQKVSEDKVDAQKDFEKALKVFGKDLEKIMELSPVAEEQWSLTSDWEETGWFDKDAWCRIKIDCQVVPEDNVLRVIDWKTGKVRDGYGEQLDLYAAGAMCLFEGLERVEVQLWYLDQGIIVGAHSEASDAASMERNGIYTPKKHLTKLKTYFKKETKALLNDTRFAPRQNQYCYSCHFRKANGGPCKY